jgi:FAD/FMN-containing dehydrogenase
VTAARLRLVPDPPEHLVAVLAATSWADAIDLAAEARRTVGSLDGLEAVDAAGLALVRDQLGLVLPFGPPPPVAVLVALAGTGDLDAELAPLVGDRPAVAAADPVGRARLWRLREAQAEAIARLGIPHKLDVTLPFGELAGFAETIGQVVAGVDARARTFVFGHLGDGNLHVNVVGPAPDDDAVDDAVLSVVVALGGSISAEHGIGRAKRAWLVRARPSGELTTFGALKSALDPAGVMNPGVLLGH